MYYKLTSVPPRVDPNQSFWYRSCCSHVNSLDIEVRTRLPLISVFTLNLHITNLKHFDLVFRSYVSYFRSYISYVPVPSSFSFNDLTVLSIDYNL